METQKFAVLERSNDYSNHIVKFSEYDPENLIEKLSLFHDRFDIPDQETIGTFEDFVDFFNQSVEDSSGPAIGQVIFSLIPDTPGELICGQGNKQGEKLIPLPDYAGVDQLHDIDLHNDPPEELCSSCWSNLDSIITEHQTREEQGVYEKLGNVGYRLRWKQKGRARDEWYDIVVRPETTVEELDNLVCSFTTLDSHHLRMYGLEGEFMNSSLEILPDKQYEVAGETQYTKASEATVADISEKGKLWEGDRLSLVYDFGTPRHYYCIVKEVYEDPSDIDTITEDPIAETETAAIVKEKRP
jgi:hypothetical protein